MSQLPSIINDLALMLVVAGIVTILFKRLKQPLILGYIVAGFLTGPHMPYMPTVHDLQSVETWSQIGVIFMMFALGLEFSFKRIVKMGTAPVIAALSIAACMITIGNVVGGLFGWSSMNRLFLGGMLAMGSETIIYKAYADLGLLKKKFASGVISVLILEDIVGIVLMVVLSTMSVSKEFEGTDLLISMVQLGFFLSLWFIVGIFVIPTFLKRNKHFINTETLLVVSVGLCFLMVFLASKAGYSPAFGAFMMGSILAETVEAEHIGRIIGSVKDLFGAIFFVSVGMLVDPTILLQYWLPILTIVAAILVGQSVFGTFSYILSGQDLKCAMQSGFSMAQIGEFAYIIASLGISLHLIDPFLYPVVVAVSIITTFLAPYMIRAAEPAYNLVERFVPTHVKGILESRGCDVKEQVSMHAVPEYDSIYVVEKQSLLWQQRATQVWYLLLKQLLLQTVIYMILITAIVTISFASVVPFFRSVLGRWGGLPMACLFTLLVISPFLRAILMRKSHSEEFKNLYQRGTWHRMLLYVITVLRFALVFGVVYYIVSYFLPLTDGLNVLLTAFILIGLVYLRSVKYVSIRLERTFRHNLTHRERLSAAKDMTAYARRLRGRDIHIASLTLPVDTAWGGKQLMDLNFGRQDDIIVVAIVRGEHRINIPTGDAMLFPSDVIEVVGDDDSIEAFAKRMEAERTPLDDDTRTLRITRMLLQADSPFVNKSIAQSNIRQQLNSLIIGVEMEDGTLSTVTPDLVLKRGDTLWIVG